jgi:hypothetical protein
MCWPLDDLGVLKFNNLILALIGASNETGLTLSDSSNSEIAPARKVLFYVVLIIKNSYSKKYLIVYQSRD